MDKLIRFRSVADSFDDAEFKQFETLLFCAFNRRKLLCRAIFHMCLEQSKSSEHSDIQQINALCKIITDARTSKPKPSPEPNNSMPEPQSKGLHGVPSAIMGNIASFLRLYELPALLCCSRHALMSCCAPYTVVSLAPSKWLTKFCTKNYLCFGGPRM